MRRSKHAIFHSNFSLQKLYTEEDSSFGHEETKIHLNSTFTNRFIPPALSYMKWKLIKCHNCPLAVTPMHHSNPRHAIAHITTVHRKEAHKESRACDGSQTR